MRTVGQVLDTAGPVTRITLSFNLIFEQEFGITLRAYAASYSNVPTHQEQDEDKEEK